MTIIVIIIHNVVVRLLSGPKIQVFICYYFDTGVKRRVLKWVQGAKSCIQISASERRRELCANGFQQLAFDPRPLQHRSISKAQTYSLAAALITVTTVRRGKKGSLTCGWPLNSPILPRRWRAGTFRSRQCLRREENGFKIHTRLETDTSGTGNKKKKKKKEVRDWLSKRRRDREEGLYE